MPTTVLAEQHFRSFKERLASYPFVVDSVSRFKSPKQQKETVAKLAKGEIDLLIGTHRLISKDVKFPDLGLVVIDEEQRFGVTHKGAIETDAENGGCADDVGHADPANAAHVDGGIA